MDKSQPRRRSQSPLAITFRRFLRHRMALISFLMILFISTATFFGPFIYKEKIDNIDFSQSLLGPSMAHPMGTDDMGQDILARILYGGRVTIAVGITSMLIGKYKEDVGLLSHRVSLCFSRSVFSVFFSRC